MREIRRRKPPAAPLSLEAYWARWARRVEAAMGAALPDARTKPRTLHAAMRYSVMAGGKRLRPILAIAAADACGGDPESALPAACAVEFVHTYSLIHDDLPCMDDDDFRRGMPTCHKRFGEAEAVLAGDALQALAFEVLVDGAGTPEMAARQVAVLSRAAGSRKLVGGQVADLEAEQRHAPLAELRFIHSGKTAAMISASVVLGAIAADAKPKICQALGEFGTALGHAFQIVDDILDVTSTSEALGKSAGKDLRDGKSTYPALLGLEGSRREVLKLTRRAKEALQPLGRRAERLIQIADKLVTRTS